MLKDFRGGIVFRRLVCRTTARRRCCCSSCCCCGCFCCCFFCCFALDASADAICGWRQHRRRHNFYRATLYQQLADVVVRHTPVLCRNDCTDRAGFFAYGLSTTYATLCFREIRVIFEIGYFPLERCPKFGHGTPTVGECDINSDRSVCCLQRHLAAMAKVAGVVYSQQRSPVVDHTRRPVLRRLIERAVPSRGSYRR